MGWVGCWKCRYLNFYNFLKIPKPYKLGNFMFKLFCFIFLVFGFIANIAITPPDNSGKD